MSKEVQEQAEPEVKETQEGGVEVSLEEEIAEQTQKVEEEVKKEEVKKPETDHFKNKVYAQDRIISKLQRELEEIRQTKQTAPEPEPALDELDQLAQKDWKLAVKKLAQEEAKKLYSEEQHKIQRQAQETEFKGLLQTNEEKVLSRYPELNDSASEHSQIWFEILNKNPRWRASPDGPILVMREMEDVLRGKGYDIDGSRSKAVESERKRLASAQATTLETSRATPSNKVILSKEQREFCDTNGITYETYARTLRKTGERGVEL